MINEKVIYRENYSTKRGLECLNSCIYNYLENNNINILQSDIFFSGLGFNIYYLSDGYTHKIKSKQYDANISFINKFLPDSIIDNYIETYPGELVKKLDTVIHNNEMLIINVSSSHLKYNKVFDSNTVVPHYINIIGMDYDKELIKISDGCPPIIDKSCVEEWTEIKDITNNWQSMNGRYLILNYRDFNMELVKKQAYKNMKKQLKNYLKTSSFLSGSKTTGYQSIIKLYEDIIELLLSENKNKLNIIRDINQQLRINGYLSSKYFLLEKLTDLNCDNKIINSYNSVIKKLEMFFLQTMKVTIKKNMEEIDRLLPCIEELVTEENEIIREVLKKY